MPHKKLARRLHAGVQEAGERFDRSRIGRANLRGLRFVGRALRGGFGEARGRELPANRRERRRDAQLKAMEKRRDNDQNKE